MALPAEPAAELSHLSKADGSATFSYRGFTVTAAVNGPIEAPRRDENAFEALVDVNVRPASGVGGTAERQLESILQPTLRQLIPLRNFPRCMIQITLQVVEMPVNAYANTKLLQAQLNLAIIPALLHAAILGLLAAAVPLKSIVTATALAIGPEGGKDDVVVDPGMAEAAKAESIHVLGFTSDDELLLAESAGSFTVADWDRILETGQSICCQARDVGLDTAISDGLESPNIKSFTRSVMESKTATDLYWK